MLIKTRGIVFRAVKYSETSIIADIYTEEKGLRSYIISGVRSKNARVKASMLQVMSLLDLVVYHREDKKLTRIKELKSAYVFRSIPFQLTRGAIGLFMVELAQKTIREESEENNKLFNFLFESFSLLDRLETPVRNFHLAFAIQLTGFLGFLPGGQYSKTTPFFDLQEGNFCEEIPLHQYALSPPFSEILDQFIELPLEESHLPTLSRSDRQAFLQEIINFYRLHLENFTEINAVRILQEVMGE